MRFTFPLYVFRCSSNRFSELNELALQLEGRTEYVRMAPIEEAPTRADCLTLLHYLFKTALAVDLPLTLIGNMPHQLASLDHWKFCCIEESEIACGDLIFVKRIRETKLLCHAAVFLSPHELFHCRGDTGAVIESFKEFS